MARALHAYRLGQRGYDEVHALQARLQRARQLDHIEDTVLCLEHEPVITLGRAAKAEHVLLDKAALSARGVHLVETGRGGDVTYHGPGQLVLYPIIQLAPDRKDVRKYVHGLEEAMIRTVADHGVHAGRIEGLNGAWVDGCQGSESQGRKIGAVGVRISRWVTMHGLALNVNTKLDAFNLIVPCGVRDRGVTSLRAETGASQLDMVSVEGQLLTHLAGILGQPLVEEAGPPPEPVLDPGGPPTNGFQ